MPLAITSGGNVAPKPEFLRYVHRQWEPANYWAVEHKLGWVPRVTAIDPMGNEIVGDIIYDLNGPWWGSGVGGPDLNALIIYFSVPVNGTAYLS